MLPYNQIASALQNEDSFKEIWQKPHLQEALFLASPNLYNKLLQYLQNEKQFEGKEKEKLINSLMRYLLRMSYRPTPFALFAGVSAFNSSNFDKEFPQQIILSTINKYRKNLQLDMQVLGALVEQLVKSKKIRRTLKFLPNNSLYRLGNQYRYIAYRYIKEHRKYHIAAVAYNELITLILQYSKSGARIGELTLALSNDEAEQNKYEQYIQQLIDAQVLLSELELSVTGEPIANKIEKQLKEIPTTSEYASLLGNIQQQINEINKSAIGIDVASYQKIASKLKKAEIPFESSKLFQMVLQKPVEQANISSKYSENIGNAIDLLQRLNPNRPHATLQKFCEAYYERYGEQEMPLAEVLDTETGIGFPTGQIKGAIAPLVDDIPIQSIENSQSIEWTAVDTFLLKEYEKALKSNAYEIELNEKELLKLEKPQGNLPSTFSAMASVVYLENGKEYISINSVGGAGASQLLARFCHADEKIEQLCNTISMQEQISMESIIRAEIVHITESRLGNILQRPVLSEYEIPYLGKSTLSLDKQIPLSDLMLSVRNNKVFLRSKKFNKQIMPALSSAHNFSMNSLPVYHFLCSIQYQNRQASMGFHWGVLSDKWKFLPRMLYKETVLSPATWQLSKADYLVIINSNSNNLIENISKWRKEFNMPQYISIADGDNELCIDLENEMCLRVLQEQLKKRATITLKEEFINLEKSFVKSADSFFTHQLIFSFFNDEKANETVEDFENPKQKLKRNFIPGDEWVYYKFYCGINISETLITQAIYPLCKQLQEQNIIDQWFFIRYADPKHHIRLRMKLINGKNLSDISSKVKFYLNPLLSGNIVSKIQIDTYQREIERYFPDTMEFAEKLFYYDSVLISSLLNKNPSPSDFWKLAIFNIHTLLNDFDFSVNEKFSLMTALKEGFYAEHKLGGRSNKHARKIINEKYRKLKDEIESVLGRKDELIIKTERLFSNRSTQNKVVVEQIKTTLDSMQLRQFLSSIIHMTLNRLFSSKQRLNETIVYDFLRRIYTSELKNSE